MNFQLVHRIDAGNAITYSIQNLPVTLGRDRDNNIPLTDGSISRHHARISLKKKKLFIEDLDSANGICVNDQKVKSSFLKSGDSLKLGSFKLDIHMGDHILESNREEWDLATHMITPEEVKAEADGESQGELASSTGAVLGFFQKAGKILENAFELDDIVNGILDLTFQIIPATRGFVLLVDPGTGEMAVRAQKFRGSDNLQVKGGLNLSTTILDHAIKQGQAVLTIDAGSDERFGSAESVQNQNIRGAICVPLKGRTEILGAIYVHSGLSEKKFTVSDLKLLTAVGAEMGVAVENVLLYDAKLKAERLAAVGQAVAGLGHCIKNILNGMEGGSFILQRGLDKGREESIHEGWDILKRNSSRLKDLMLDMLAYSKPREPVYANIDANSVPREVVDLLQEKASSKGAELLLLPDENIKEVVIDGKAIYRGLLNLVTNALDACPQEGGRVEVKTQLCPEEERFKIFVRDNGCGISKEDLKKMGKAFFSTKGAEGTGLGLSVTYKVIEEHKGHVEIDSEVGVGTTFVVTLPIKGPHAK